MDLTIWFFSPGLLLVQDASERAALIPAGLSDGQFYSPPESEAGKPSLTVRVLVHFEAPSIFLSHILSISQSV